MNGTTIAAAALAVAIGALALGAAGGCSSCEDDIDCLIMCDCDGDGTDDAVFPHECSGGVCTEHYDSDARKGCETLCDEALSF